MQQQEESFAQAGNQAKRALPAEAFRLAESYRLGKPTAYYQVDKSLLKAPGIFLALAVVLFAANVLFVGMGLLSGDTIAAVVILLIAFPPFLYAVYLSCKERIRALKAASAHAYFCQHGLIYSERWRQVVLRWDEIERVEIEYRFFVRLCQVKLGNGKDLALVNAVGGNLSGQIKRRLLRARKKHQHPEIFHQSDDFPSTDNAFLPDDFYDHDEQKDYD